MLLRKAYRYRIYPDAAQEEVFQRTIGCCRLAASDWIIEIGPGAGDEGGRIVALGTPSEGVKEVGSRTARYLATVI